MTPIQKLSAREILDSRGRTTLEARCQLQSGAVGVASVPSGASTGLAEAHELRDGDPTRYGGLGCRKAVAQVNQTLHQALAGNSFDQAGLDAALVSLDGSPNKQRLGANALLGVSLAFARAVAMEQQQPLYSYLADLAQQTPTGLPRLTVNLFSGGKHAGGQVAFQDVLLVPLTAATIGQGLEQVAAVYQDAVHLIRRMYEMRELKADEGGLAPPFATAEAMLHGATQAIEAAGLEPGRQMALALDVASSQFYHDGLYRLDPVNGGLSSSQMVAYLQQLAGRFPLVSLEDGLAEDDWPNWPLLRQSLERRALVLGDDFLCTNPQRITIAIKEKAANALLLKVNQIGTLSEALEARTLAIGAGWQVTVSARSGETEDHWLADLAVAWGHQIKVGSIRQSERLSKYNRLLQIEEETGLPVRIWGR